jgi:uncharacterized protein (TIGR00297 family)
MPCAYGPSTGIPSSASVAPGNQSGDGSIACAHRAIATRRRALGARRLNHRALQGLVLSAAIAFVARRARALTPSGVIGAIALGTVAVAAGWDWGILLIAHFIVASALSRVGAERKARRTASLVAKGGERDLLQVLANGAVFGMAAVASIFLPAHPWFAVGAGALAASAADTWATEIGTLARGSPRSIRTLLHVPPGTSGGVSAIGTIAMVAGAAFIAALATLFHWPHSVVLGTFLGGVAGAVADTALGATIQERRRCLGCGEHTERKVHICGSRTRRAGGIGGLDNDVVNFLATVVGGGIAFGFFDLAGR